MYLQDVWVARPLQPPPAQVDSNRTWSRANSWYSGNLDL